MAAVASHKEIALESLSVQIERTSTPSAPQRTLFQVRIDLGSGLSQRERIILYNSARRCEVYKLLSGEIAFEYQLVAE